METTPLKVRIRSAIKNMKERVSSYWTVERILKWMMDLSMPFTMFAVPPLAAAFWIPAAILAGALLFLADYITDISSLGTASILYYVLLTYLIVLVEIKVMAKKYGYGEKYLS